MTQTGKIVSLLVILILVFVGIGWVLAEQSKEESIKSTSTVDATFVDVELGEKAIPSKRVIIHDRFVGEYDKDANIVTIAKNGNAYNVRNGVVLVDETVIKANEDEYTVRRLDKERFSVSSS